MFGRDCDSSSRGMCNFNLIICTAIVLLLITIASVSSTTNVSTGAITMETSIYYNVNTNSVIPIKSPDATRLPFRPIKLISEGLPCSCSDLRCGCCAGINISAVNLDRHVCANISILPEEFVMDFDLFIDDNQVYTNRLSARNPPPMCVPLYFFPAITFCVRFFDLHIANNKLNGCIDFETKIAQSPLLILHFNCVEIGGSGGIEWVTPTLTDAVAPDLIANASHSEVYDHVNFELSDEDAYSHTSTLTPEEEYQIGTLKL